MRSLYSNVNRFRRTMGNGKVRSVKKLKKKYLSPEQIFDRQVVKAAGTQAAFAGIDVARNMVEMVEYWRPILDKARRHHRMRPRIPAAAKEAMRKVGLNPPVRV